MIINTSFSIYTPFIKLREIDKEIEQARSTEPRFTQLLMTVKEPSVKSLIAASLPEDQTQQQLLERIGNLYAERTFYANLVKKDIICIFVAITILAIGLSLLSLVGRIAALARLISCVKNMSTLSQILTSYKELLRALELLIAIIAIGKLPKAYQQAHRSQEIAENAFMSAAQLPLDSQAALRRRIEQKLLDCKLPALAAKFGPRAA